MKGKVRVVLNLNPFRQHTMGLDIYFKAKAKNEKLRKEYDELYAERRDAIKHYSNEGVFEDKIDVLGDKLDACYDSLYSDVAYFRKVNFLLPYFGYEENCSEITIDKCEVEELVDDCKRVLAAKDTDEAESVADELLPTEDGYFFGSTDYDEWYFKDVQEVMDKFTEILDTFDFDENELIMDCWW